MDLVAPSMHSDNLLDQIYSVMPRLKEASIDVGLAGDILLSDYNEEFINSK